MKPEQSEELDLHFLLEEYNERFQHSAGSSSSQTGTATSLSPAPVSPAEAGLELEVLLENYSFLRKGWLPEYQRLQSELEKNRTAPAAATAGAAPLFQLLVEEYAPADKFWEDFRSDTTRASVSATGADNNPDGEPGPNLLLDWDITPTANWRRAGLGSLAIHSVSMLLLLTGPFGGWNRSFELRRQEIRSTATLFAPSPQELSELTQPDPNKGAAATQFSGPAEQARPLLAIPETQEEPAPPKQEKPEPAESVEPEVIEPPEPEQQPPSQPDPPETEKPRVEIPAAQSPNPGELKPNTSLARIRRRNELPAPRSPKVSKPKLVLENPSATSPGREGPMQLGSLKLSARPGDITEGALRQMREGTSGRARVGDGYGTGGLGGYLPPSPGNTGSNLELMSDPGGVDFRPYLIQVLAAVRRNWHAVIPESARLGMNRGSVSIQFAIAKSGSVPKLVIASSSGVNSLDRAAVAGISASNPFPALPREFTGDTIRLQFAFQYNQKKSTVGGL